MSALYQNKYRVESMRLKGYDYTRNGIYFITICTYNSIPYFGKISSGRMFLYTSGETAKKFWMEIPLHFPFVKLDEFVIMPDHIHGILTIKHRNLNAGNHVETPESGVSTDIRQSGGDVETPRLGVSTGSNSSLQKVNKYWKSNSLGSIINQYKRICTIIIRKTDPDFRWQAGYYDHIITSEKQLFLIRDYIKDNPDKWIQKHGKFFF